jgi:hypothetical protein
MGLPKAADTAMEGIAVRIASSTPLNAVTNCGQHTVIASNANPNGRGASY